MGKNRLILVEGIPGSGKTTISNKIKEYLSEKGEKAVLYNEGELHPADMAWNSLLTLDEYKGVIESNKEHEEVIKNNTIIEDEYAIVAYTKLGFGPKENKMMEIFENHEVYGGRVGLDVFKEIHLKRWKRFNEDMKSHKEQITIFECAFLQNHIGEILGDHNVTDEEYIKDYFRELIDTVKDLNPKLIYLNQESVEETINRVAKERISDDKDKCPDWIDIVIDYYQNCKYGKENNLKGYDSVITFLKKRKELEGRVIDDLKIDKAVINNLDYDWEEVTKGVLKEI